MQENNPLFISLRSNFKREKAILSGNSKGSSDIEPKVIRALRQGDHGAYDKIFVAYYKPIKEFLMYLTKSEDDAQDLAQQVFMQLWESRESIQPGNNLKGFLYNTARNITFNLFDHRKVVDKYLEFQGRNYDLGNAPDDEIAAQELQILIELAVSKMPPKRQEVFRLRFEENKSYDEIANLLGLNASTVRTHVTLGKDHLREMIKLFTFLFMF